MRRKTAAAITTLAAGLSACSFDVTAMVDGGGDASSLAVSFATSSTVADEASGLIGIDVQLSEASPNPVTVNFAVTDGTATRPADFTGGDDGSLTFVPGVTTQQISLTIAVDALEGEGDETIVLSLASPSGAMLGTSEHVVTIADKVRPRVSVGAPSSASEGTNQVITFMLDAPPTGPVSVDFTVGGGTASGGGPFADYTLTTGTVNFAAGETMQTRALGVVQDTRNEIDEDVVVTLVNPVGVAIGAVSSQNHTIQNDDAVPSVSFTTAASMPTEGNVAVTLTVALSAASGLAVAVPWSVAGTATDGLDYTVPSVPALIFPEGTTTQTLMVNLLEDTLSEPDETVIVDLGAPTNATLGAPSSTTITIVNDDESCFGNGSYAVCYPAAPTVVLALPVSINTDSSLLCQPAQPTNWTAQGQPDSCFVYAASIGMVGATRVIGSRPLVLVASGAINISFTLDAASRVVAGPGSTPGLGPCTAFPLAPSASANGAGAGAGGTFMSIGGNGGPGDNGASAGTAPLVSSPPSVLRGGCNGQLGGAGDVSAGAVGRGGGAVYLVAGGSITITNNGVINVSGAGGAGAGNSSGGSGGGSGGMIKLDAPVITATGGVLFANGGGGAEGGDDNSPGGSGQSPTNPNARAAGGVGGSGGGGNGGGGFATGLPAQTGMGGGAQNGGGGGGGGGGGYIQSSVALTGATVSAGLVQ